MRATEFIKEGKAGNDKLKPHYERALPKAEHMDTDSFYGMYRLGIAIAGDGNASAVGPANEHPTVWLRYDGEKEKLDQAKKTLGITSKTIVAGESDEMNSTNTVSPVAKPKPNKYGV